jgi:long-chain acyl-CoA synthetase
VRAGELKALFIDERFVASASWSNMLLPGGHVCGMAPADRFADGSWLDVTRRPEMRASYPRLLSTCSSVALPSVADDASAFILFTSGTTSRPKGVEVTHAAVAAHMATMHAQYGYGTDSRIINGLPLHHSDGINHGAVNLMAAGGTLFRTGAFTVQRLPEILRMVRQRAITHMITVPTVIALIAQLGDEYSDSFRADTFRFISSTAGPLDEHLWRSFEDRFGTMIVNSYGLTETICEGFYCGPTPQTRRIGTIGKPIDIDVRLIDGEGHDVPRGRMGELILRGSCVMKGYYNAPEETAGVLKDGWLHTGDLAVMDEDGFFSITGRKKNVIITGGLNVYPEDVSRTIARMAEVADVVTIGVPDATWGERVVSCVVPKSAGLEAADVVAFCRLHLSREKVPSEVLLLDELPRGASGKIVLPQVKTMVAEQLAGRHLSQMRAIDRADAGGDVAHRVLKIAASSFKTAANQLSLASEPESTPGWTSLAHVDFLMALESEFRISISPAEMLSIETLADAVAFISRHRSG